MTGYVYAIECAGRIKIGFSEDPEKRFNKVASDAPFPCDLLGYWPGSKADELEVQQKFRELRVHGEWFASTESLLAFIADIRISKANKGPSDVQFCGFHIPRGMKTEIAQKLGITHGAISQWEKVPATRVLDVERITGIPRDVLRPDIFGETV